jgi:hypothetical protein
MFLLPAFASPSVEFMLSVVEVLSINSTEGLRDQNAEITAFIQPKVGITREDE